MKKLYLLGILLVSSWCYAQQDFAILEKNRNREATTLLHELNTTKDTLLLKSDKKITYVYSINSEYKREIDVYAGKNSYQVPLTNLSKGKHVFVVSETPRRIVFVVYVNGKQQDLADVSEVKLPRATSNN